MYALQATFRGGFLLVHFLLVHILVCAVTAAFRDRFFFKFCMGCILLKSTHILFLVMLPLVFCLLYG